MASVTQLGIFLGNICREKLAEQSEEEEKRRRKKSPLNPKWLSLTKMAAKMNSCQFAHTHLLNCYISISNGPLTLFTAEASA